MPEISVIVPVYNAEKYLKECVESICNQTLTDIEMILVDDGSTDGSPKLCDAYAALDPRIRVIHQPNMGISAARNAGINVAAGKWIAFVDSDDFVDPEMYQSMVEAAGKYNVPLVMCTGYYYSDAHTNRISRQKSEFLELVDNVRMVNERLWSSDEETVLFTTVWNKIYSRHFFEDTLMFREGIIHEDEEFSTRLYLKSFDMVFVDQPFYYYRANTQSITYKPMSKAKCIVLQCLYERSIRYREKGWEAVSEKAAKNFCEIYIEYGMKATAQGHGEWVSEYKQKFGRMRRRLSWRTHPKDRIRYMIYAVSPAMYQRIVLKK